MSALGRRSFIVVNFVASVTGCHVSSGAVEKFVAFHSKTVAAWRDTETELKTKEASARQRMDMATPFIREHTFDNWEQRVPAVYKDLDEAKAIIGEITKIVDNESAALKNLQTHDVRSADLSKVADEIKAMTPVFEKKVADAQAALKRAEEKVSGFELGIINVKHGHDEFGGGPDH